MKIAIINGPNVNMIGTREPEVYGNESFESYFAQLDQDFPDIEFVYFQSNVEGELINFMHSLHKNGDARGVLLNAGGYTHTSVALADTVAAISIPCVEIHISNVFKRETFRHTSYIGSACIGSISGFGLESYRLGVQYFLNAQKTSK
ncbi:MAG: type II 3-dehydroquinate dehydratase [Salibacteraceae bacterium]